MESSAGSFIMASKGRSNFTAKVNKYRRNNEDDEFNNEFSNQLNNYLPKLDEDEEEAQATSKRFSEIEEINTRDEQFGFIHYSSGPSRIGWILNMKSVSKHIYSSYYIILYYTIFYYRHL